MIEFDRLVTNLTQSLHYGYSSSLPFCTFSFSQLHLAPVSTHSMALWVLIKLWAAFQV